MPHLMRSTALVALLTASPALADVTPDDVWAMWQAQAQAMGLTLEAEQHRDGDALVIDSARLILAVPEEDGTVFFAFNGVRFDPADGGAVLATYPETLTFSFGIGEAGEMVAEAAFKGSATQYQGVYTGAPEDMSVTWTADGLDISLTNLFADGTQINGFNGSIALAGPLTLENRTQIDADHLTLTHSSNYGGINFVFNGTNINQNGMDVDYSGTIASSVGQSQLVLPRDGIDIMDLPAQLRAGMAFSSSTEMGRYETNQVMAQNGTTILDQSAVFETQTVGFGLDKNGVVYDVSVGQIALDMSTPDLPVPMILSMETMITYFAMPLLQEDGDQQAVLRVALQELAINDEIWAMFDPEAKLTRTPLTFKIDVGTTVDMLTDLVDFEAMEKFIGKETSPVLATAVDIKDLFFSATGVEVASSGSFTLNNDDLETYDGFPAPAGEITTRIEGAHGLIDRLIEMGLLGDTEALGARAALNLLTVADDDGILHSQVEIKADGQIIANGQRIK